MNVYMTSANLNIFKDVCYELKHIINARKCSSVVKQMKCLLVATLIYCQLFLKKTSGLSAKTNKCLTPYKTLTIILCFNWTQYKTGFF